MTEYTKQRESMVDGTHFLTDNPFSYPGAVSRVYLTDSYPAQPDYNFDAILGCYPFFDQPVEIFKAAPEFPSDQSFFDLSTTTISNSPSDFSPSQSADQSTLLPLEKSNHAFTNSPASKYLCDSLNFIQRSARSQLQTPSPSEEKVQLRRHSSPGLLPRKRRALVETPNSEAVDQKPPKKKRGRPSLHRTDSPTASFSRFKTRKAQPHNEVERKYREGLNNEFERLWKSLPSLMQGEPDSSRPLQRPSKAIILSSAVEYIKSLEEERDTLRLNSHASRGIGYFNDDPYQ